MLQKCSILSTAVVYYRCMYADPGYSIYNGDAIVSGRLQALKESHCSSWEQGEYWR